MDRDKLQQALLQAFSEEGPDLFSRAESTVFDLEVCDVEQEGLLLDHLKRALHSLKGSSSAIGRADIRDVSHAMEDILFFAEKEQKVKQSMDLLHEGLNYLREAVVTPSVARDPSDTLRLLQNHEHGHEQIDTPLAAKPNTALKKQVVSDEASDSYIVVDENLNIIQDTAALIEVDESAEQIAVNKKTKEKIVVPMSSIKSVNAEEVDNFITETIRVSVDKIESMQSTVGELVAIRLQQEDGLSKLADIQSNIVNMNNGWRNLKHDFSETRKQLSSNLVSKMDSKLAAFTAEMKLVQSQVFHLSNQMGNQTGQLTLLSDEMDGGLKAIRMMPLGPFLESYRSVAREAAQLLGKTVVLECIEKGIEIDRLILQKIKEPILHLIRNSVGHGIESPAERKAIGKPEIGNITVLAELQGEFVSIRISDDGAGVNRKKIYDKALKLGLIKTDDDLSDKDILDIVSHSGFSTSDTTDKVSGRGIGMDVVANALAELGGSLDLESMDGVGSCFAMRVPSSLATSQGLILQIGNLRFGIVLDTVERIVRSKLSDLGLVDGKQVIYIDDEAVSVTSLGSIIGMSELEPKSSVAAVARPLVIIKTGNHRLALMVDDIPGEIPMIIKTMGPQFEHVQIYSGGAILSDGAVLPVLNARHIVNMVSANNTLRMGALSEETEVDSAEFETMGEQGVIIVVDDSITTRTLERNILEAAGYRVSVATDGIEALDLLMIEDNVSLVVTDLEMPRMNGLELCKAIRSGRYSNLPIIMVTSLGNEEEQKKGLDAGADAYIVKNDFQQETFLNTVKRLAL